MTTPYLYDARAAAKLAQIVADAPYVDLRERDTTRPDILTLFLGRVATTFMESGFDAKLDKSVPGIVSVAISPLFNRNPARMSISVRNENWYLYLYDNTGRKLCPTQAVTGFPVSLNQFDDLDPPSEAELQSGMQAMSLVSKVTQHFFQWVTANLKRDFPPVTEQSRLARSAAERLSLRDSFRENIVRRSPGPRS